MPCEKYKRGVKGSTPVKSTGCKIAQPVVKATTYALHTSTKEIPNGNLTSNKSGSRNFTCEPITENAWVYTGSNSDSKKSVYVNSEGDVITTRSENPNFRQVVENSLDEDIVLQCPHCGGRFTTNRTDAIVQCPNCTSDVYLKDKRYVQAIAITTNSDDDKSDSSSSSSSSDSDSSSSDTSSSDEEIIDVKPIIVGTKQLKKRKSKKICMKTKDIPALTGVNANASTIIPNIQSSQMFVPNYMTHVQYTPQNQYMQQQYLQNRYNQMNNSSSMLDNGSMNSTNNANVRNNTTNSSTNNSALTKNSSSSGNASSANTSNTTNMNRNNNSVSSNNNSEPMVCMPASNNINNMMDTTNYNGGVSTNGVILVQPVATAVPQSYHHHQHSLTGNPYYSNGTSNVVYTTESSPYTSDKSIYYKTRKSPKKNKNNKTNKVWHKKNKDVVYIQAKNVTK